MHTIIRSVLSFAVFAGAFLHSAAYAQTPEMIDYPYVKLRSLDKATARTMTFEARVGSTLKFGTLYMRVQACKKAAPIEEPESAAFLQIWEVDTKENSEWIFSGWMFKSSPALSAMDHPIYDVWVIDCLDQTPIETPAENTTTEEPPQQDAGDTLQ